VNDHFGIGIGVPDRPFHRVRYRMRLQQAHLRIQFNVDLDEG